MTDSPDAPDWRTLPRKPAGTHRSVRVSLRLTPDERDEIHQLAEEARQTLVVYRISIFG